MADEDVRTRRLEWIRDGSVWLVGISTGALVLSATYFFDRFNQQPRAECLLVVAWVLLLVAITAGIFTAFSTWKDLRPAPPAGTTGAVPEEVALGKWVARCYTTMMWTFLFGFIFLIIVLLVNVLGAAKKAEKQKIEMTIPANVRIQVQTDPPPTKQNSGSAHAGQANGDNATTTTAKTHKPR